jgi:hypothetical protein
VQVAAWLVFVQVKNKWERLLSVRAPGVEKTSRLGSRDPVASGSNAGHMVEITAIRTHGRFLGWASKPRSSRNFVGAKSWVGIGGGYTEFEGFPVVHQKTIEFLGWSTNLRPKTGEKQHQAGLTGRGHRSDRCATMLPDALKRRTRVGITRLAPRLCEFVVTRHPSDGATSKIPKVPFEGVYVSLM